MAYDTQADELLTTALVDCPSLSVYFICTRSSAPVPNRTTMGSNGCARPNGTATP